MTYYEPFLGGGALFWALAGAGRFRRAVLSDVNLELVRTYQAVQKNALGVLRELGKLKHAERDYYRTRDLDPEKLSDLACAARMIYLNRTGFNGLYRVNAAGEFNVPFGAYAKMDPPFVDVEALKACGRALSAGGVSIVCRDFRDSILDVCDLDFCYYDPPYAPISETADFVAFTKQGFGQAQQEELAAVMMLHDRTGVAAIAANSDTTFVRSIYRGMEIEAVRAPRGINAVGSRRGDVGEVMVLTRGLKKTQSAPPPPTAQIRHLLPKLADLPREAEETLKTEQGLRARIAELERAAARTPAASAVKTATVTRDVVPVALRAFLVSTLPLNLNGVIGQLKHATEMVEAIQAASLKAADRHPDATTAPQAAPERPPGAADSRREWRETRIASTGPGEAIPKGERAVLTAIAQHGEGVTREQLTVLTGYKRSSRDTYLQKLAASGRIDAAGDRILVTPGGLDALGAAFVPLPTGDRLREHWLTRLPEGERRILDLVAGAYPASMSRDAISDATNYKRSSRDTYLQKLAARRLVEPSVGGGVRASDGLFS